jgi:phospholipid/cholesterol/gamma-HCH transport system substrate-binding protein
MLKDGDQVVLTQSALQLEDLIGKFLVNGSPSDNKNNAGNGQSSQSNPQQSNPPAPGKK